MTYKSTLIEIRIVVVLQLTVLVFIFPKAFLSLKFQLIVVSFDLMLLKLLLVDYEKGVDCWHIADVADIIELVQVYISIYYISSIYNFTT